MCSCRFFIFAFFFLCSWLNFADGVVLVFSILFVDGCCVAVVWHRSLLVLSRGMVGVFSKVPAGPCLVGWLAR